MIDRGQTLLVGAIALAVLFVSLALVLNTAIYGSTIASQGSEDVTGGQTIALQSAVERDVGFLIEQAIEERPGSYDTTGDDQQEFVEDNVSKLDERYTQYYAENDRIVSIETTSPGDFERGGLIEHGTGTFAETDVTGTHVRNFRMNVTDVSGTFTIRFEEGGDFWDVNVSPAASGGVEVQLDPPGPTTRSCTTSETEPWINVTSATLDGDHCNALDFFEQMDGDYDVTFLDRSNIEGSYSLVANGSVTTDASETDVIYAVDVTLNERSTRVDYENTIRVAPGELR